MTALLGFLSLVQVCVLPGALVRRCFPREADDGFERAAYTFALSLMANACLVTVLGAVGLFNRPVLLVIMAAELALLVWLRSRETRDGFHVDLSRARALLSPASATAVAGTILALASLAILIYICYLNWGTVFRDNDDVASWNRWAREWTTAQWPTRTYQYPQLLPTNWAITYVLMGQTSVQMFAKSTTTLFALLTAGLFVSLALRHRRPAYLFGAAIFTVILMHYMGITLMMMGYADIPVAFFAFAAFHALHRRTGASDPDLTGSSVLLALLLAFGALITKQGGVYAVAAALACAGWLAWKRPGLLRAVPRPAWLATLAVAVFAAAWYGFVQYKIYRGTEISNLEVLVTKLHHGRTYGQRLLAAWDMFQHNRGDVGVPITYALAALVVMSVALKSTRWITLGLIAPFLIAYGWWFSYEIRNAAMAFPLLALVAGFVLERIVSLLMRPLGRAGALVAAVVLLDVAIWILLGRPGSRSLLPRGVPEYMVNEWIIVLTTWFAVPVAVLSLFALAALVVRPEGARWRVAWGAPAAAGLGLLVALLLGPYGNDRLLTWQVEERRQIGIPAVNERLYAAVKELHITQPIMSNYWFLSALPDLESLFRRSPCGPCSPRELMNLSARDPSIGYFLLQEGGVDAATKAAFDESPELKTIFVESGFRLLQVRR